MRERFDVCVLGSLNLDLVVRAPRLPSAGETLLGGPFERHPGGKGANQAVAAARMGARVAMIGAVGDDDAGEMLLGVLRAEGIDVARAARRGNAATGVALITVVESGENTIVVAPGANATVTPSDVEAARGAIGRSASLLAQLEVPLDAVERAFEIAKACGVRTVLNAAPAQMLPPALLAATDALIVNEGEARSMTKLESGDVRELATALLELGPSIAVVTCGARGAVLATARAIHARAAFAVDAVDSVGAGDAFAGALARELALGAGVERAIDYACAAGALACTVRGAIPSLPLRAAVEALVNRNR